MLRSDLCDSSDAYILVKGTITVTEPDGAIGFTLKHLRDMTRTYSQMHRTDKYSEHSSIIWPLWLNG